MRKSNGFSARQLSDDDLHPLLCGVALKVQLPNYQVAHKSGWTETSFNDAGIVLEHNDGPYLIAILSSDPEGNILCPLARYLDEIMLDYFNWLD